MVRRLVQKQQIRLFQQQLCQRDPHLPTAGELLGETFPVVFVKAKAIQHRAHLRFDGVPVARPEFAVHALEAIGDLPVFLARRIHVGHAMRQRLQLFFHRLQTGENRHAFVEHRAALQRQAVLRKVARRDSLRSGERAVVQAIHPGQDLQHRGFSGAVGAHQTHAVLGVDQPVEVLKEKFMAETFSGSSELQH